jgi:transposase
MAWSGIARREHSREGLRYPSDMTDREWMVTAPFIPPAKRGGRRRTTDMREAVNAMLYIAASGCAWRLLPKCFPPVPTVRRYSYAWRDAGLFDAINMALVMSLREIEGREASPSVGVIDSQSVKTRKVAVFVAMTLAKRSKVASDTSSPTPVVSWSTSSCMPPMFRTGTALRMCSRRSAGAVRGCAMFSPMVAMPGRNCATRSPAMATGPSRSSSDQMPPKASKSCLGDGSSSAPSHGSGDAAAWRKTGKRPSLPQPHGRWLRPSEC